LRIIVRLSRYKVAVANQALLNLVVRLESEAAERGLDTLATKSGHLGSMMSGALAAGVAAAGVAIAGAGAAAIHTAGDFESTLNRFASVTGSSVADAGLSLDQFSQKFLQLGQDTQFSAQQAADAAVALAKGGVPVADILGQATEATLGLAAAGELELAPAAEIVAKQLGVWGNTGVTAAQVADRLAQAANASTVDVDELAMGLAQAGGSAKVAGVDFDELTQTMALIAPSFQSASDAGTSLKTFLGSLTPSTGPAKAAMADLGLLTFDTAKAMEYLRNVGIEPLGTSGMVLKGQLYDLAIQTGATKKEAEAWLDSFDSTVFYDAQGNFVGMAEAAQLLQTATKNLTEEQRIQALETIFGSDAIRAAAAIAEAGATGFDQMGASMAAAGSAAEQAAIRNQGWNFAVDQLKGSLETLAIVVGTALLPAGTALINDFLLPGLNAVLSFVQSIESWSAVIGPLMPLIVGLTTALGAYAIAQAAATFAAWGGVSALGALIATAAVAAAPFVAIGVAVAALYAAWQTNFLGIRDIWASVWEGYLQPAFTAVQGWLATTLPAAIGVLAAFWTGTLQPALLVVWSFLSTSVIPLLVSLGTTVFSALQTAITTLADFWTGTLQPALSAVWGFINENIVPIFNAVANLASAVLGLALQTLAGYWNTTLLPALQAVWAYLNANVIPIVKVLAEVHFLAVQNAMSAVASVWTTTLQPALSALGTFISGTITPVLTTMKAAVSAIVDVLNRMADAIRAMPSLPSVDIPGFGGGRARGGPVIGNTAYLVGERGPELFLPSRSGYVASNRDTQRIMGTTTYITIDARGATARDAQTIGRAVERGLRAAGGDTSIEIRMRS
jgi:hypothetical protein